MDDLLLFTTPRTPIAKYSHSVGHVPNTGVLQKHVPQDPLNLLLNTDNGEEKCYLGVGWGDWMFNNCKKFCHYCTPGHPGKIIKDHPHYQVNYHDRGR